jgi:hypothetical protein
VRRHFPTSGSVVLAMLCCIEFEVDCPAGHCGPNEICITGGGCVVPAGACTSSADCAAGDICVRVWEVTVCRHDTGADGERCSDAPEVAACVQGASCVYHSSVELQYDPDPSEIGDHHYFDHRPFGWTSAEPFCAADRSLTDGEFCLTDEQCAPGLICNNGYMPPQCRPRSALGGPCTIVTDCAAATCGWIELDASYGIDPSFCALADPSCDIRTQPACGYWLSCSQCLESAE